MQHRFAWLPIVAALLALGLPSTADSLRRLETFETYARSRHFGFKVSRLPHSDFAYGRPAQGTLFAAGDPAVDQGRDKPIWQCVIPAYPTRVFVQDEGHYVLLFCTYMDSASRYSRHALVVVGSKGNPIVDLPTEAFLTKDDLRSAPQTVSFVNWDEGVHPVWEEGAGKSTLRLRLLSGRELRVDLSTGKYTLAPPLP